MTLVRLTPLCAVPTAASAVCSLGPVAPTTPKPAAPPQVSDPTANQVSSRRPLDLAAFRTPIWVVPPPPPAPPAPPPPPPPLKLQLIAITTEGEQHVPAALVYDPDQDKLLAIHAGDTIGGRKVEKITLDKVHIRDSAGERVLALRGESTGGSP